jgi:hypothetical protein
VQQGYFSFECDGFGRGTPWPQGALYAKDIFVGSTNSWQVMSVRPLVSSL